MKNLFFAVLFLMTTLGLNAQEQGRIRVAGNMGICSPTDGLGMSIDVFDIRYNILDNLNAGIKMGGALMLRDMGEITSTEGNLTMHLSSNVMFVGDYYFHYGNSAFAPFLGAGFGSFNIYDIFMKYDPSQSVNYTYNEFPFPARTVGGSLRGGFELGRLRLAMEYYMIPNTKMYDAANIMQVVGMSPNSYMTINLGFYFGGGSWHKRNK